MSTFGKTLRTGVATTLLLAGITTGAWGQVDGGSFGQSVLGTGEVGMQIKGEVVCAGCGLAEVQEAQPDKWSNHLYRVTYRQKQQMVMKINWVSDSRRWNRLITMPHLRLRGAPSLFEQLTAEENRFKEVEVSGILSPSQTLNMNKVTILE